MGISALTLGGWISVYCGFSLLRTSVPTKADQGPTDTRKKLAAAGYFLLVLGLAILARAIVHRFH